MSGRGTANLLTRTTAVLAVIFMGLSLTLALLDRGTSAAPGTVDPGQPAGTGIHHRTGGASGAGQVRRPRRIDISPC